MTNDGRAWLYVLAILLPLAAFAVQVLSGRRWGRLGPWIATGGVGASFVLSVLGLAVSFEPLFPPLSEGHPSVSEAPAWTASLGSVSLGEGLFGSDQVPLSALKFPASIWIDGLAALLFVMITGVATLVHLYSSAYMEDDPHLGRYFAYLSLFCFSMLALVASANLLYVFVCWELVGVCSYLLIGFWSDQKANTDAAIKAFVVNRVGDVGLIVGMGLLWWSFGTLDVPSLDAGLSDPGLRAGPMHRLSLESAGESVTVRVPVEGGLIDRTVPYWVLTFAGLGVFLGCAGKSAQVPLHVWLPDAMAGPTPVSALIHAATMVAAGVYLVARLFPLFTADALLVIAYTGGITLLLGASVASVQTDYKKVLAYSTVSQLGFMMLSMGVGGWAAGLFHLLTHAFFKALLFLGAGSVYRAVHTYDLRSLGGLRHKMPVTAWTMLAGTLAIAGVPFFSGFYSKDAILADAAHLATVEPGSWPLFAIPAVGALLTAFYMFRMWFLLFDGHPRSEIVEHARESPGRMTVPLVILAVLAVVSGWPTKLLPVRAPVMEGLLKQVEPLPAVDVSAVRFWAMGASVIVAAVGVSLAVGFYSRWKLARPRHLGPVQTIFMHKWYFEHIYDSALLSPVLALARSLARLDRTVLDGLLLGAVRLTRGLSRVGVWLDAHLVDGLVSLFGKTLYVLGDWSRHLQTGRLRGYLGFLAFAVVVLFAGMYWWIQ